MKIKKPSSYKEGDRVRLKETCPPEYDPNPEEDGVIVSMKKYWWGWGMVVRVDEQFRHSPEDDGLRECDADQIKEKL